MKAFIIFRDRVTYAKRCYTALALAGLDVHVIDHASTWPAAIRWLHELGEGGRPVLRRRENAYPWEVWEWGPFRDLMEHEPGPYIVTDPDVIPAAPADWVDRLEDILRRSEPDCVKVGLGLRNDNIPPARRAQVMEWEQHYWRDEWEPGVFRANTDTTLALYRPWKEYPWFALGPALRTGPPYLAEHLAWYEVDSTMPDDPGSMPGKLSPELRHYYSRADQRWR